MAQKTTGTTLSIINIDYIKNDVIVLKNGGLRRILLTSGINFDLKSEEEKNVLVFSYQEFLNSLNFSIQEIIHSRKLNIEVFLKRLQERQEKEPSSLLKNIIEDYREFVASFVAKNPIMSKTFFVVVPYNPIYIPKAGKRAAKRLLGIFGKQKTLKPADDQFNDDYKQLELRVDQVIDGLNRIGLRAIPLIEKEIAELFYNFYNPATTEEKTHFQATNE